MTNIALKYTASTLVVLVGMIGVVIFSFAISFILVSVPILALLIAGTAFA